MVDPLVADIALELPEPLPDFHRTAVPPPGHHLVQEVVAVPALVDDDRGQQRQFLKVSRYRGSGATSPGASDTPGPAPVRTQERGEKRDTPFSIHGMVPTGTIDERE